MLIQYLLERNIRYLSFIIFIFYGLHIPVSYAFIVKNAGDPAILEQNVEIFDNRKAKFEINDILHYTEQFWGADQETLFLDSATHNDYWFKYRLHPDIPEKSLLLFQWLKSSEAYFVPDHNSRPTPLQIVRPKYWGYSGLIQLPKEHGELFIRFYSEERDPPVIIFSLLSEADFLETSFYTTGFFGAVYGIYIAMIFYNFILALSLRRYTHFVYVVYGCCLIVYTEAIFGYFSAIFNWSRPSEQMVFYVAVLSSVSFSYFSYVFLKLKEFLPATGRIFIRFVFYLAVILLALYPVDPIFTHKMMHLLLLLVGPLIPIMGAFVLAKGYHPALWMLVSAGLPTIGTIVYVLMLVGILRIGPVSIFTQVLCFASEMILMSLGIGQQIRLEKNQLIANMNHGYTQLKKMVYPHQLHLIQSGHKLEETMPIGKGEAVVIAFDIIRSTHISHPDKRHFFEGVFHACYQEMMEGYDNLTLSAPAYRVKEMGDGFLCSVGFPFQPSNNQQIEPAAILLAIRFLNIFKEHVQRFNYSEAIYCSISLARGQIEGFFPHSGTQEYDLFGEAIVLADRYEGLRKLLFQEHEAGHIITVQAKVYDALPARLQTLFHCYHLNPRGIQRIRDDATAKSFYYLISQNNLPLAIELEKTKASA